MIKAQRDGEIGLWHVSSATLEMLQAMKEALELLCNVPEQSYEEFLSTFTHMSMENITGGCLNVFVRDNNASALGIGERRNADIGVDALHERASQPSRINRAQQVQSGFTTDLEELVLDGTGGRLENGELIPSYWPVKFDNYLGDMDKEEAAQHTHQDVCVLPGEEDPEEDFPVYTPSFCHHTLLELSSTNMDRKAHTPQSAVEYQNETEEVVPFTLDDTFDYDNVALSHKLPVQCSTRSPS